MMLSVRKMESADRALWAKMRARLWPEETAEQHSSAIDTVIAGDDGWGFVAETAAHVPVGFAELAIRKYANGCESAPVAFLEGIWTDPAFRRRGIGARLIKHIESFLIARGFGEIGSDTPIENKDSQAAHRAWGFSEPNGLCTFANFWIASSRALGRTLNDR